MLEIIMHSVYEHFVKPCIPGLITVVFILMTLFLLIGMFCAENRKQRIGVIIFFFVSTIVLIFLGIILLASFSLFAMIIFIFIIFICFVYL